MQCNLMQCNVISLRNEKIEQNIFQKWSQINLMKSDTLIFFFLGGGVGGCAIYKISTKRPPPPDPQLRKDQQRDSFGLTLTPRIGLWDINEFCMTEKD